MPRAHNLLVVARSGLRQGRGSLSRRLTRSELLSAAFLAWLSLVAVTACGGSTPASPAAPASVKTTPAVESTYRAVIQKDWQPVADAYAQAPCSKRNDDQLPSDAAGCKQGGIDLAAKIQTFLDELSKTEVPASMAGQNGYLKDGLTGMLTALAAANKAIDDKDGPKFSDAAQAVADNYTTAAKAKAELLK